jgi:hypothetical protein
VNNITPWYPPEINPVYVGWYQREYEYDQAIELPDYWTGQKWLVGNGDGTYSDREPRVLPWRGLEIDP